MNKRNFFNNLLLIVILIIGFQLSSYSQNYLSKEREGEIKTSGKYYWGVASDFNEDDAKKEALSDLANQIISANVLQSVKNNDVLKTMELRAHIDRLQKNEIVSILAWIAKDSIFATVESNSDTKQVAQHNPTAPDSDPTEFLFEETVLYNLRQTMQNNANAVFSEIYNAYKQNKSILNLSLNNVTEDAKKSIQMFWETSPFYCTKSQITANVSKSSYGNEVRGIPVFISKAGKNDQNKTIILEFAQDGRISDITLPVWQQDIPTIIDNSHPVTEENRLLIIRDFVENFRTAYNKKDIVYIDKVFSNDALIIVGKVLKQQSQKKDDMPIPRDVSIKYVTLTKQQYMRNLNLAFKMNEYINIKFPKEDIKIRQHKTVTNIYGVTLHQIWNSSTYNDDGWVFLVIDFKDENNPLIWVRTWQPYEYVLKNDVFKLSDFDIQ